MLQLFTLAALLLLRIPSLFAFKTLVLVGLFLWLGKRACDFHVEHLNMVVVIKHFGRRELASARYFRDFILPETNYDVLRLKVGVNDLAHAVQVVQPDQTLPRQLARKRHRNALVIVAFDDL